MVEQAIKYIRDARNLKLRDDEIKMNLSDEGWKKDDIEKAFRVIESKLKLTIPKPDYSSPQITVKKGNVTLWDTFEHILMFISLYVMVVSVIILLNAFVDRLLPGVNVDGNRYGNDFSNSNFSNFTIRSSLASLIVSYPLFGFFFLNVMSRTKRNPDIRGIMPRKILTYLTLILTFLTVSSYVIAFLYTLLSGNVTFNFMAHFFVTVAVAIIVFLYYLNSVKEDRKSLFSSV